MPLKPRMVEMCTQYTISHHRFATAITVDTDITPTQGIFVNTAGNLTCLLADCDPGEEVTFTGLPVGFHPLSVKRVAAGSTAVVLALY